MGIVRVAKGVISLKGKDRLDFLHRMSTNDLLRLNAGAVRQTVLTTEKGRIVDAPFAAEMGEETLLISSRTEGSATSAWLERFLFSDDVAIRDLTDRCTTYAVFGKETGDFLRTYLRVPDPPVEAASMSSNQRRMVIMKDPRWHIPVWLVTIEQRDDYANVDDLSARPELLDAETGSELLRILRIESGIPAWGTELTADVNPLEAGLKTAISYSKGCYIGQEVIARIDTYGKLSRNLTGFLLTGNRTIEAVAATIWNENKELGRLTGACYSHAMNRSIGLGYLTAKYSGEALSSPALPGITIETHPLPFFS